MSPLKMPIGESDFRRIVKEGYYFADKSLFVKDILEDSASAILITRPRRFGKTLNLSMLRYYCACVLNERIVFSDLKQASLISDAIILSFLLMTGYFKVVSILAENEDGMRCQLAIPNLEIRG